MARRGGALALAGAMALASAPAWAQSPAAPASPAISPPGGPRPDGGASAGAQADLAASTDLERRIAKYQEYRLIYEPKPSVPYLLRQGPDEIFESDLVALLDQPELTQHWSWLRARDWGLWLGAGAVGVPLGGLLFANNFVGQGPLAFFSVASQSPRINVNDPRAFALGAAGLAIAGGGLYFTGLWAAEVLDRHHPQRLDDAAIKLRVNAFNDDLRDRLDLVYESLPPPPTPRPSPSPSASPSVDPFAQPLWAPPTPQPGTSLDYPMPLPEALPMPLPLLDAPAAPRPSPSARPWLRPLWFPTLPSQAPSAQADAPASAPQGEAIASAPLVPNGSPARVAPPSASPPPAPRPSAGPSSAPRPNPRPSAAPRSR